MASGNQPTPSETDCDSTTDTTDTEEAKEARLNKALASIPRDPLTSVNLKATAREYDVSYDTLRRRHRRETKPKKIAHEHLQKLTPAQEQKVVDWAIFLSIQGRPVEKDTLTPKLTQLCPAWAKTGGPSKGWWDLFFNRHPEIRLRKASGIPPKRARVFNFTAVNELFEIINTVMEKHSVPWRLLLNVDEKGLQSGSRKVDQKKCLVPTGMPNTVKLQSDDLQLITVIECVTAEGVAFDPTFIFPGESHIDGWFNIPGFEDSHHMCCTTKNGWTQTSVFVHWLRECLIPQLNNIRKPDETALLLVDGHSSHESDEADQISEENNIQLVRLPPHTTHKLQPLDVGLFGPMQAAWRKQCKNFTLKTLDVMPLSKVVEEYLDARTRVMKESNIVSAWKKSGILSLDPNSFNASDYGPSQLTSTNAFLPPSFLQTAPPDIDLDLGSDMALDSSAESPCTSPSASDDGPDSNYGSTDSSSQPLSPRPHNGSAEPTMDQSSSSDSDDVLQPAAGPSHFPGSYDNPMQPLASRQTPTTEGSTRPQNHPSHYHTPSPSLGSDDQRERSQYRSGLTLPKTPGLALTPRRTRSRGFLTPLPPKSQRRDRRFADRRSIDQKYRDALDENEQLREKVEILQGNQAKLENLLQAAETDCFFARQHITALQTEHNAKKKDKQKRGGNKAEWLTSEANKKKKAEEKVEREKREAEEKATKERKEVEARERQGLRNERAVSGKFTGLVTGKKNKDELKGIAQALCLETRGKNQELADRINRHLDEHPHLQSDERFKGLFAARTKKATGPKKRKNPTPAASDAGQNAGDETVPPPQKPRLH